MNIYNVPTLFLDFDGVVKESVDIKINAFEELFVPFGNDVAQKVKLHHQANSGMSRFDKLPLYFDWAGLSPTCELIEKYADNLSALVTQKVIDSPWVPGVLPFIKNNKKKIFLITATPQQEIEFIVHQIGLSKFFTKIVGAPTSKIEAIKSIIVEFSVDKDKSVMIGDSKTDYQAANLNGVSFLLRRTNENKNLQQELNCQMIDNFIL